MKLPNKLIQFLVAKTDLFILLEIFVFKLLLFYTIGKLHFYLLTLGVSVAGISVLLIFCDWFSFRFRIGMFILIDVLLSAVLLIDSLYLSFYNELTSISLLAQAGQIGEVTGSLMRLLDWKYILYFIDIPLLVLFYRYRFSKFAFFYENRVKKSVRIVLSIGIIIILFAGSAFKIQSVIGEDQEFFAKRYSNKMLVEVLGVYNYHVFDVYDYIKNSLYKKEITSSDIQKVKSWFDDQKKDLSKGPLFGKAKGQNVILIQEEALQAFVVNLRINGQEVTPNLNKLTRESVYFNNFYDQTAQGTTSDGEFISLVSLYPSPIPGSIFFKFAGNDFNSLPKVLNQSGYMTMSAHGYIGSFWNREIMHPKLGIQKSIFAKDFANGETIGWGFSDGEFFKQIGNELANFKQPFFTFLITLTNHHPYDSLPRNYHNLDLENLEGTMIGDYLQSVHYADKALGEFITSLKNTGLYESSILVIYGDHDAVIPPEQLKQIGINSLFERQHDKVPFIIHSSVLEPMSGEVVEKAAGHLDITPTLLYLLGISQENSYFMGESLFDSTSDSRPVIFRDGSFVGENHIFVSADGNFENGEYFNSQTGEKEISEKDIEEYRAAQARLEVSDLMILGDLFPRLTVKK